MLANCLLTACYLLANCFLTACYLLANCLLSSCYLLANGLLTATFLLMLCVSMKIRSTQERVWKQVLLGGGIGPPLKKGLGSPMETDQISFMSKSHFDKIVQLQLRELFPCSLTWILLCCLWSVSAKCWESDGGLPWIPCGGWLYGAHGGPTLRYCAALLITRARINIRVSQYKYDSADQIWASSFIHLHTHTVTHCPRPVTVPTWLQPLFIEQRPLLKSLPFVPFILYLPWKTKLKNFYCRTLWDVKS